MRFFFKGIALGIHSIKSVIGTRRNAGRLEERKDLPVYSSTTFLLCNQNKFTIINLIAKKCQLKMFIPLAPHRLKLNKPEVGLYVPLMIPRQRIARNH